MEEHQKIMEGSAAKVREVSPNLGKTVLVLPKQPGRLPCEREAESTADSHKNLNVRYSCLFPVHGQTTKFKQTTYRALNDGQLLR